MNKVNVALIQMSCGNDPRENMNKCLALIEEAARQGAHVILTQELFRSRYLCQSEDHANFDLAEPIPGPSTELLTELAAARGVVIIGSLFEHRAPGLYHNTAVVIDANGRLTGVYRKMHILSNDDVFLCPACTPPQPRSERSKRDWREV